MNSFEMKGINTLEGIDAFYECNPEYKVSIYKRIDILAEDIQLLIKRFKRIGTETATLKLEENLKYIKKLLQDGMESVCGW